MNFCSPATSFKKDNEDYNILDCSSQCEIDQEEIADTSSPECSEKKHPITALGFSSSNKKKISVKRKLLLQKPILDIHPTSSNLFVRTEDHFQKIKRKKLSTYKTVSNGNEVQNSVQNKLNENSMQYVVSIGHELQECNYDPTRAALTAGLIKSPSPEIFSEKDNKVNSELYSLKDEIICSQDSFGIIFSEDEKQLSVKASCETSNPTDTIGNEDNLDEHDIKEEIICSQDVLDISIRNDKCIASAKLNDLLGPIEILQEEGHEDNLDDSDIKEEIVCSQDSLLDISIKNNKLITESPKLNGILSPFKLFQDKDEDYLSNSDAKEEIIGSQDSVNKCEQVFKKIDKFSSPKNLLFNEDSKDHSDLDSSKEDIIYSQDSAGNISGIESNIFTNMCDKPSISLSPSKFSIEGGKQEENIDFDGLESDNNSEKDSNVTLASSTNSLQIKTMAEKVEAMRYSKENEQQYNDPICSPTCNNIISQIEIHEPNSEFLVKAPKKGTLLQRAYRIISDLKKEANLLSYEIQVGLRASKGAFVSEPLIIHSIYFEEKNYIISCKPQKIEEINNPCHVKESIYIVISNLPIDMRINSVIIIHFPLVALFGLPGMKVILFTENRVQVISSNRVTGAIDISIPNLIIEPSDKKLMCVVKKNNSKTVIDAIVDQLFGKHCTLELKLLHIFKERTATHTAIELLTVDSENQFCLVKDSEYNLLKDLNLEVNNSYIFLGFTLICSRIKNEVKSAAEYYSSLKYNNDFIFIMEPCNDFWKINHLSKTVMNTRNYSSLKSVNRNSPNYERFEFLVKECKVIENKILIRDEYFSEMTELQFDEQCHEHKIKLTSSVPVVLCGVYFLNGCLYFDKYCQLMVL